MKENPLDNSERPATRNRKPTPETPQPPLGARLGYLGIGPGETVPEVIPGKQNVLETSR